MHDKLAEIIAHKRDEVARAARTVPQSELEQRIADYQPTRGFLDALERRESNFAVIAEIKRASPSAGRIREDFDVKALARSYQQGGAACLSILTDEKYFEGSLRDLALARQVTDIPLLRKDFMIDPYQVVEARAAGADAILLILAALSDSLALALQELARELGMDVLVEVHDGEEFARALRIGANPIGINNRNLRTFETKLETSSELAGRCDFGGVLVSESGIREAADLATLRGAGIGAFLIGESLMRAPEPGQALRQLVDHADSLLVDELTKSDARELPPIA